MSGTLVILSGPSGVGKDTVIDAWQVVNPLVERVVAVTTRPPRDGEVDGKAYHFVSPEVFERMAAEGKFLEHKLVHGNWYATPASDVNRLLSEGKTAILKIDVQGAIVVMGVRPDATTVFLLPPSNAVLEQRIRQRGTEDEAAIQARLHTALAEIALAERYQHKVVNDTLDQTVSDLQKILEGLR
ncbi:MAG: guanylate kinase [Armatimonadetes bacterium]|nr:guanylate kinase [Armatimonadota bacterium]